MLARTLEADLYLLHVFEVPLYSDIGVSFIVRSEVHQWVGEVKEEESKRLEALAEEINRQGVEVHPLFKGGKPFLEILKAAEEIPADLIVLGTHGRTGLPMF